MPATTSSQASTALAIAEVSAERVRLRANWTSFHLTVFGGGFAAVTLLLGMVEPKAVRMTAFVVVWLTILIPTSRWAERQPARTRGVQRRAAKYWIGTAAVYGATLLIGTPRHLGQATFWFPAAVLVAAPLLVGAYRERRP